MEKGRKRQTEGTEGFYVTKDGKKDDAAFMSEMIGEDLTDAPETPQKGQEPRTND